MDVAVSEFAYITGVDCTETALYYLKAKDWRLDEALNMFYARSEWGSTEPPVDPQRIDWDLEYVQASPQGPYSKYHQDYESHRQQFLQETDDSKDNVLESEQENNTKPSASGDGHVSLYRQPFSLMYKGSFEKAKAATSSQNKWLIVNLQSNKEFNSHLLNKDTWADETVEETIRTHFIFWQVYDDKEDGMKVCTYYKVVSLPAILVIDPITGQKLHSHSGTIQPHDLLEVLLPYTEKGPKERLFPLSQKPIDGNDDTSTNTADEMFEDGDSHTSAMEEYLDAMEELEEYLDNEIDEAAEHLDAVSLEDTDQELVDAMFSMAEYTKPMYLPLPEEPKGSKETVCRIGVRLPDGRRLQRSFLRTDPVEMLWSFCSMKLAENETRKPFVFMQAIPGAKSKVLVAGNNLTFEEADLCNALVSLAWL